MRPSCFGGLGRTIHGPNSFGAMPAKLNSLPVHGDCYGSSTAASHLELAENEPQPTETLFLVMGDVELEMRRFGFCFRKA